MLAGVFQEALTKATAESPDTSYVDRLLAALLHAITLLADRAFPGADLLRWFDKKPNFICTRSFIVNASPRESTTDRLALMG